MILFFLFALACAWSFAVMGQEVGGAWGILRIGSALGAGISLLLLVFTSISNRRHRRAERDEGSEMEADEEQPSTEERGPTYEEVFGLEPDLGEGSLPSAPEEGEWPGDEVAEIEAEAQPSAEGLAPTSDDDVQALDADLDEAVDQVDALDAVGDSQEELRRMREEFKARAEEAALRVKQREAELHEASSAPDPKR